MSEPAPCDLDAERSLLGVALLEPRLVDEVLELATGVELFYDPYHALVWRTAIEVRESGRNPDPVSVAGRLRDRKQLPEDGVARLAEMVGCPTGKVSDLCSRLIDKAKCRSLRQIGNEISGALEMGVEANQILEDTEAALFALRDSRDRDGVTGAHALSKALLEAVKNPVRGVTTGFRDLDTKLNGGLKPGYLYILAGRPSMGKSALGMQMALETAKAGNGAAVFSLEMGRNDVMARWVSGMTGVSMECMVGLREPTREEWGQVASGVDRISKLPVWVDETPALSVASIRARARRVASQCIASDTRLSLIVVDYLQLCKGDQGKNGNREQEISSISRALKALAKELGCAVLALSQLNRSVESREEKRPQLSDLRESGAIEQDADLIAFVYRDAYYREGANPKEAEVIVRKQRNGTLGTVMLGFDGPHVKFSNPVDQFEDWDK